MSPKNIDTKLQCNDYLKEEEEEEEEEEEREEEDTTYYSSFSVFYVT